jgi:hypothetical protein
MSTRKRTKAATATNGHTIQQKPANIAIDQGHGLGAVAAQLADLEDLYGLTFRAHAAAGRKGTPHAGVYTPAEVDASNAAAFFHDVNHRTHDLTDTLQDLILQMEPRTLDEALSLALVYKQALSRYLSYVAVSPESMKNEDMRDRERKLDRALDAMIRGLVHGAGAASPLLEDYFCKNEELPTWDALRRKVAKLAPLYPYNHGAPAGTGEETK